MNNEYSFNSGVVRDAIVNLKSAFFDIYSHQTSALVSLQSNLDRLNPNSRSKAEALIIAQGEKLSRSMLVLNDIIRDIESVNANGLKVEKLLSSGKGAIKPSQMVKKTPDVPVNEEKNTGVTETVQTPIVEVKTEPATEASTEVTTEAATEAVQTTAVEVKTEPATEAGTEVTTEAATEAVQTTAVDVKTEPATEANTEVSTEVSTETVVENTNADPVIIPVANSGDSGSIFDTPVTEPQEEKEYIADTPEQANLDMFNMFKSIPGMEKMKMNADGTPDFSAVLPKDIAQKIASSGDTSLSGIISAIAKETKTQSGVVEPILPVISTENSAAEESGEISTEVSTETIVNEEQTTEAQQEVGAQQVIIPTIAPPAAPPAASVIPVVDTIDITAEVSSALESVEVGTEATTEAVIATDAPLIPVIAGSTDNQETVISTDVISSVVTDAVQDVAADETGYRRFIGSDGPAKAILVSDAQYGKLMNSFATQEALMKFKKFLPDLSAPVKVTTDDTANMSDDDKRKTIEAMMADATALYNAGRVEEAQVMYDKISDLNKTLVKS